MPKLLSTRRGGTGSGLGGGRGSRSSGGGPVEQFEITPTGLVRRHWLLQVLLALFRWLPEIAAAVGLRWVVLWLTEHTGMPTWAAVLLVVMVLATPFAHPVTRRMALGLVGVAVSRHRLRAFFIACRVVSRSGRLPIILSLRPSAVGERGWLWMPSGLSARDIEGRTEQLAAACWAREARVSRSRRFSMLVEVHIVRRDPLTTAAVPSAFPNVLAFPAPGSRQRPSAGTPVRPPVPPVVTRGAPPPVTKPPSAEPAAGRSHRGRGGRQ